MKCAIILSEFQRFDEGTKPIKDKGSKKDGLVIGQSAKDIIINYSINFKKDSCITLYYLLEFLAISL